MNTNVNLEVTLAIAVENRQVWADLRYRNTSDVNVYIEKVNGCLNGKLENNVFRVTAGGKKIGYTGIYEKRNPPGPEDFSLIGPHEQLSTRVRLDDSYAFTEEEQAYQVYYTAIHSFPDSDDIQEIKSNVVVFRYSKPG